MKALTINVFRRDMEHRQKSLQDRGEVAMVIEWFFMVSDPQQVPVWAALGLIPAIPVKLSLLAFLPSSKKWPHNSLLGGKFCVLGGDE